MYDLRYLRDNLNTIREQLGARGADVPWDELGKFLTERKGLLSEVEQLRHQLKKGSDEVATLKRAGQSADQAMADMKVVGDRIKEAETGFRRVEECVEQVALRIPNIPHASVPPGRDATENIEVRRWGAIPSMGWTPRPHWELGERLGILDFERAAKIAGARFAVLTGLGAKLERALINYMLDCHAEQHGYREVLPLSWSIGQP